MRTRPRSLAHAFGCAALLLSLTLAPAPAPAGGPAVLTAPAAVHASQPTCTFTRPDGSASSISHVINIQFDNVHFTRDNPSVPSDLEQMPHLLSFIETNGVLLSQNHTPLIAHTADDLITGLTGLYGDQHGLPISNSFEVADPGLDGNRAYNAGAGAFNTSAFAYWTDTITRGGQSPAVYPTHQMLTATGTTTPAPWVPFTRAGCNVGAVSTANMVLENATSDVDAVFGVGSDAARESASNRQRDFVGLAVHCADAACASVGSGPAATPAAMPDLLPDEPGGYSGFGALFGHRAIASQVPDIHTLDPTPTPITGFRSFDPSAAYSLGYMEALLLHGVPVVYGYVSDVHDCRCGDYGAFAPGEAGYVAQLHQWDAAFGQFLADLASNGITPSNTVFVFQTDENDHYAGTAPLNPGCDGVTAPCTYNRDQVGEVDTNLPLLLDQQGLYRYDTTVRPAVSGDLPFSIDYDTAPGFWLQDQPPRDSAAEQKLRTALLNVTDFDPYSGTGTSERLFRYLVDGVGLKLLHMQTADPARTPNLVGFAVPNNFIQMSALNTCNAGTTSADGATCLNHANAWMHGDYAPDVNTTWLGLVGPGVAHPDSGLDSSTWADHADIRPTLLALLCLPDDYRHAGRPLIEDLQDAALSPSAQANRGALTGLATVFKQINAPVNIFGQGVIQASTTALAADEPTYQAAESTLASLGASRDALAASMLDQLEPITRCDAATAYDPAVLAVQAGQGQNLLQSLSQLAGP